MALNDQELTGNKGVDVHPGLANPTLHSIHPDPLAANFVTDPTTDDLGAGAGPTFQGDRQATRNFKDTAGVVEGRPGVIETTNIDPLNENSNKDDGWANASTTASTAGPNPLTGTSAGGAGGTYTASAMNAATNAAAMTTDAATKAFQAGKEAVWGSK